jgi:hypothetical protein
LFIRSKWAVADLNPLADRIARFLCATGTLRICVLVRLQTQLLF